MSANEKIIGNGGCWNKASGFVGGLEWEYARSCHFYLGSTYTYGTQNRSLFLRYYSLLQTVLQTFLQSKQLPETSLPVSSENFLSWRKCKACRALSSKFSIHPGHKHFPTRNRLNCTNFLLFFNHSAVDQPWQRSSASPGEPNMCRSPLRS